MLIKHLSAASIAFLALTVTCYAHATEVAETSIPTTPDARQGWVLANLDVIHLDSQSLTTAGRKKEKDFDLTPPGGRLICEGYVKEHHRLGYADWRLLGSGPTYAKVRLTVKGKSGRGKVLVELWGSLVPEGMSLEDARKICSLTVQDRSPGSGTTCDCDCIDPDGTIRGGITAPSPQVCTQHCRFFYKNRGRCERWSGAPLMTPVLKQ